MVKNTNKTFEINKITNAGDSVLDQIKYFNIDIYLNNLIIDQKETHRITKIRSLFTKFVDTYSDFKTILSIQELLSPSKSTRSKSIPRPQNAWVLYRKNLSKGLNLSVGEVSGIASYLWKNKSERETKFWNSLHQIIKEIHAAENPNYLYKPKRINQNKKQNEIPNNLITENTTDGINDLYAENSTTQIDTSSNIDLTEVDIEMIDAELFQSHFYDPTLYDNNLFDKSFFDTSLYELSLDFINPAPIDTSFSFIDPTLIDNSFEYS